MAIFIIEGGNATTRREKADELRNAAVSAERGCLLVADDQDGDPRRQLEKVIFAVPLPDTGTIPAEEIPWKVDPVIILCGKQKKMLEVFEKIAPGFNERMGAVEIIKL